MITIHLIDAFTLTAGLGNRAGVVFDADGLSDADMQAAAAFANVSETAFILNPSSPNHEVYVRYFTPMKEVPICGHATIAVHFLRAQNLGLPHGAVVMAKTGAGILAVDIDRTTENLQIVMTQGQPEFGPELTRPQRQRLLGALGLKDKDIVPYLPIEIASTGHSKVMVPMISEDALHRLAPDLNALEALSRDIGCNGYFTFTINDKGHGFQTHGRMFAPAIGIAEDPVTGNANGPAGAYLARYGVLNFTNSFAYNGIQGEAMGKPGTVNVRLFKTGDLIDKVQVAGFAVNSGALEFKL